MNALIIDDEFMPGEYLEELVKKHCPEVNILEVMTSSEEALDFLQNNGIDLVFLDIEMPGLSGFDLIESLPEGNRPSVIFTTAYHQYAIKAFELSAIHYLLKPVDPEQLKKAVSRIPSNSKGISDDVLRVLNSINEQRGHSGKISLPEGQSYHLVDQHLIVRIEGAGSYCTFYLEDGRSIMVSKRIKVYAEKLDKSKFIRTHRSHIVNANHVSKYNKADGGYLELLDGTIIPISPKLKVEIKEKLGI